VSLFPPFLSTAPYTSATHPLSLHDALPIFAAQTGRGVAEGDHVAGLRVDLRMRGEGLTGHLAVECSIGLRLQGRGVHEERRRIRSEEHTSELQSPYDIVCRLLLAKKNANNN